MWTALICITMFVCTQLTVTNNNYAVAKCFLPQESTVVWTYIIWLSLTVLWLVFPRRLFRPHRTATKRSWFMLLNLIYMNLTRDDRTYYIIEIKISHQSGNLSYQEIWCWLTFVHCCCWYYFDSRSYQMVSAVQHMLLVFVLLNRVDLLSNTICVCPVWAGTEHLVDEFCFIRLYGSPSLLHYQLRLYFLV
jgi:hypothetical protein